MTRRNIVGMLLSRFNYNRVTVTIVHISVREWLPLFITIYSLRRDRRVGDVGGLAVKGYKNSFFLCRHIPADNVYIARIMRSLFSQLVLNHRKTP